MSGSQNLSTPLSAAQVQNAPIVVAAGCNRSATQWNASLACMRALNVSRLVSLIPNAWNCPGIFGLPKGWTSRFALWYNACLFVCMYVCMKQLHRCTYIWIYGRKSDVLIPIFWSCEAGLGGMHWQALAIVDGRTITHSFSKSLALSNFSDVPIMYVICMYWTGRA